MYLPRTRLDNVSRTALGICAYCALVALHPALGRVFHDPFAPVLFRHASPEGAEVLARYPDWPSIQAAEAELGGSLRLLCHVAWRKRWMAEQVARALRDGAQQVVILGSGLDTMALRMGGAFPDARFFEIDQTATLAAKQTLVHALFGTPPQVIYTAVDFATETAEDKLRAAGFDPALKSVFVAEVSLEYVRPVEVEKTWAMIQSNSAPGTVFLTTVIYGTEDTRSSGRALQATVASVGEPLKFLPSTPELEALCARTGFRMGDSMRDAQVLDFLAERGVPQDALPFSAAAQARSSVGYHVLHPH